MINSAGNRASKGFDTHYIYVALLAAVLFVPFLGGVHLFDWDEINFAECAREMLTTGNYLQPQRNYEPFWEKPPLFMWFQAISMHLFGINEFAARFPNAVCGIITLLVIFHLGKKMYGRTFGWLWVLSYAGSILPHLYFKSGIIDPWFNLFIFLSIVFWIKNIDFIDEKRVYPKVFNASLLLAAVFSGLCILTKGPAGFLIITLTLFFKHLIFSEINITIVKKYFLFSILSVVVALSWFGIVTIKEGTWFVKEFIEYNVRLAKTEDAGHGGFFGYHVVVLFFGCFPASIFALKSLFKTYNFYGEKVDFTRWMRVLFFVVLILFSLVQSKIVHYSSMCYLPLTFLSAITLYKIVEDHYMPILNKVLILSVGILIGLNVAIVPYFGRNIDVIKPLFSKDAFALKNLEAQVHWTGLESLVGLVFFLFIAILPFLLKKYGQLRGVIALFVGCALFVQAVLIVFINKIEGYSQNAAIEFYNSKQDEDCYIKTYGFKSYAHLFYAKKRPQQNNNHLDEEWLLTAKVDKPTYFVCKVNNIPELNAKPTLSFLYEKNGFAFYKRVL